MKTVLVENVENKQRVYESLMLDSKHLGIFSSDLAVKVINELAKQPLCAMDIAKRLLDYGYHSPTIYFPQIVSEALMIEPTESESKESLDAFIGAMKAIALEAQQDPELVKSAPHNTPVGRLDGVLAARKPNLSYPI